MDFKAVNDRISMLRVRGKFFNITLFSVHAPNEEKEEEVKDAFNNRLEEVYNRTLRNDVKII
jgi:hypothetical protein